MEVSRRSIITAAAALVVLLAGRQAAASGCYLGPFVATTDPPLGCPLHVYVPYVGVDTPRVSAIRDNVSVELTATAQRSELAIDVWYYQIACDGSIEHEYVRPEPYTLFQLDVSDAQIGDELYVDYNWAGTVGAAGPCPLPMPPTPYCSGAYQPCEPPPEPEPDEPMPLDDGGIDFGPFELGCSAGRGGGGAGGAALAIVMLALGRARGRRRETP